MMKESYRYEVLIYDTAERAKPLLDALRRALMTQSDVLHIGMPFKVIELDETAQPAAEAGMIRAKATLQPLPIEIDIPDRLD